MDELGQSCMKEIVVPQQATLTGFAMGRRHGNIWALCLDPAHQGLQKLWLGTERNTRAQAFYARRGWQLEPPHDPPEVRMVMLRPV